MMYAVMTFSIHAGTMTMGSWFYDKHDAEQWAIQESVNYPLIYEGHSERTPYVIEGDPLTYSNHLDNKKDD